MLTGQTGFSSNMSCFWPINIMKKKLQGYDNINQKQQFIQDVTVFKKVECA